MNEQTISNLEIEEADMDEAQADAFGSRVKNKTKERPSGEKLKSAVLYDLLAKAPCLLDNIGKALADGHPSKKVREVFEQELLGNPDLLRTYGGYSGSEPFKIWHPEFLDAVRLAMTDKLRKYERYALTQTGMMKRRECYKEAIRLMDERSAVAKQKADKRKKAEEPAGEKPKAVRRNARKPQTQTPVAVVASTDSQPIVPAHKPSPVKLPEADNKLARPTPLVVPRTNGQ